MGRIHAQVDATEHASGRTGARCSGGHPTTPNSRQNFKEEVLNTLSHEQRPATLKTVERAFAVEDRGSLLACLQYPNQPSVR